MSRNSDRQRGDSRFGRTLWDFIHDHSNLALPTFVGLVLVVLSLAYVGTSPGDMVVVMGVEIFRRPESRQNPSTPVSTVINADTVVEIRLKTEVRELRELEDGKSLSSLPNGVFGFVTPFAIDTDSVGGDRLTLNRRKFGTFVVEIHKSSDAGKVYVIGYVSPESLVSLQDPSRNQEIDVTIFFESFGGRVPIAIPKDSILESDNRSIDGDDGQSYYVNDMKVR